MLKICQYGGLNMYIVKMGESPGDSFSQNDPTYSIILPFVCTLEHKYNFYKSNMLTDKHVLFKCVISYTYTKLCYAMVTYLAMVGRTRANTLDIFSSVMIRYAPGHLVEEYNRWNIIMDRSPSYLSMLLASEECRKDHVNHIYPSCFRCNILFHSNINMTIPPAAGLEYEYGLHY